LSKKKKKYSKVSGSSRQEEKMKKQNRDYEIEEKVLGDITSVKYADFPGNCSYAGQV
jgi:hypothetical protein